MSFPIIHFSEFCGCDTDISPLSGYALVLNSHVPYTYENAWSHLYTPTIELREISCLGFYTMLIRHSAFQVQLVWSERHNIYKVNGDIVGLNKVNNLFKSSDDKFISYGHDFTYAYQFYCDFHISILLYH